jgi:hypothetical protein
MNMSLPRVKRLLPDSEYEVVRRVVRARSLSDGEISELRGRVRGWRDKYVDRAHQQAREARKNARPRSTRGAESNENTMRQADIMNWILERLSELESQAAGSSTDSAKGGAREEDAPSGPSREDVRRAIGEPHLSTFGDLWAEFPETPVPELRKLLWELVEAGEVELTTAGGLELTAEEEVAFVEEVQQIDGIPSARRGRSRDLAGKQQDHFARTKVVRIHAHKRASGARSQARRDNRGRR